MMTRGSGNASPRNSNDLESVEQQISGQEVPDTYRDVGRFNQAALHYGLSSTRHTYDWLTAFETEVTKHDETT